MTESADETGLPRPIFGRFGSSWAFWIEPAGLQAGQTVTFCLCCHGHGGYVKDGEADWLRPEAGGRPTLVRLVERGLLTGISHGAGDAWGNRQAQDDCVAFVEAMRERYDVTPQLLVLGRSMGAPLAINLTLGPLAGQVGRLALLQPVVDLAARMDTNPNETLPAAFGNPAEGEWASAVAPFCPTAQLRALADRGAARPPLPSASVWQNGGDQTCRIEATHELADLWRRAGGQIDVNVLDGEGHTVYGGEPVASQVAAFLAARRDQ